MWTRAEVKAQAKEKLQKYYWAAVLMCFITAILGGEGGNISTSISNQISNGANLSQLSEFEGYSLSPEGVAATIMVSAIVILVSIAVWVFSIFVGGPLQVGLKRYFLESREQNHSAGIATLFWVFSSGHYLNVVKIMFLKNLYTGLWSLLLVIPGIVKAYEYSMIPYLLAENPELSSNEVFQFSRELTDGEKLNLFVLDCSFIGWNLLGILICCGVGLHFVTPYIQATWTEVYLALNPKQADQVIVDDVYGDYDPFA